MKKMWKQGGIALLLGVACTACAGQAKTGEQPSAESTAVESMAAETTAAESMAEQEMAGEYIYGKLDVPYADFYYGELNKLEPEAEGAKLQLEAADPVKEAGMRDEGMYDAVSSATNEKSKAFEASFTEDTADGGVNILGPKGVNVAIEKQLYEAAQAALKEGKTAANPLLDFVKNMYEVNEEKPAEYKVLLSDGTLSRTMGEVESEKAEAEFLSVSRYGNYQINLSGIDPDIDLVQGVMMQTEDGKLYGLLHEDNIWRNPLELAFASEAFTESHGNEVAYQRFADLPGKTITKLRYFLADETDIELDVSLFCKYLLKDGEGIELPKEQAYDPAGTKLAMKLTMPEGSAYKLEKLAKGKEALPEDAYTLTEDSLMFSGECKPGKYTIRYTDEKFADIQADVMLMAELGEHGLRVENNRLVIDENAQGLSIADVLPNLTRVYVNGERVRDKKLQELLFNEDGSLKTDAKVKKGDDKEVEVFEGQGSFELKLQFNGYPEVVGTVEK